MLQIRHVAFRPRFIGWTGLPYIAHDANDCHRLDGVEGAHDLVADDVLTWECPPGECFVDDGRHRRIAYIAVIEVATAHEGDAQRRERARRNNRIDVEGSGPHLAGLRNVVDPIGTGRIDTARRRHSRARGYDARHVRDASQEIAKEERGRLTRVRRGDRGVGDQHAFGLKSQWDVLKRDETSDEQTAGGQEHDR